MTVVKMFGFDCFISDSIDFVLVNVMELYKLKAFEDEVS